MQTGTISSQVSAAYAAYSNSSTTSKTSKTSNSTTDKSEKTSATSGSLFKSLMATEDEKLGKIVGDVQLSEKAQEYYESLKEKYGDYDFILVSSDMKEAANANAAMYGNSSKSVILIDEEKIEKMATDEAYREKYESIISGASDQLQQLRESIISSGANITSYGATVNDDGTTSYFAVVDQSLKAQQERIEAKREQAKEEAKKEAKAEAKKEEQEKLDEKRAEAKSEREAALEDIGQPEIKDRDNAYDAAGNVSRPDAGITITADSIDELVNKISDTVFDAMSDSIETEQEKAVGHNIDFSV